MCTVYLLFTYVHVSVYSASGCGSHMAVSLYHCTTEWGVNTVSMCVCVLCVWVCGCVGVCVCVHLCVGVFCMYVCVPVYKYVRNVPCCM